jgi:hypothetical protein
MAILAAQAPWVISDGSESGFVLSRAASKWLHSGQLLELALQAAKKLASKTAPGESLRGLGPLNASTGIIGESEIVVPDLQRAPFRCAAVVSTIASFGKMKYKLREAPSVMAHHVLRPSSKSGWEVVPDLSDLGRDAAPRGLLSAFRDALRPHIGKRGIGKRAHA